MSRPSGKAWEAAVELFDLIVKMNDKEFGKDGQFSATLSLGTVSVSTTAGTAGVAKTLTMVGEALAARKRAANFKMSVAVAHSRHECDFVQVSF